MRVSYSRVEVPRSSGRGPDSEKFLQTRVKVDCPFVLKDAVKATGFAAWHQNKQRGERYWHIPATSLALRSCAANVAKAAKGVRQFFVDDLTKALYASPSKVSDVSIDDLPRAVLKPWDHQRVGSHMIGQLGGVMLAYDLGAGKTKSVLDAIVHYDMKRCLVVCPASVIDVWRREAEKHLPDDFDHILLDLDGRWSCAKRRDKIADGIREQEASEGALIIAINYEAISSPHGRCIRDVLSSHEWDLVAVDESHRISNYSNVASKFLASRMAHLTKHRVALSGTPLGQGLENAFGQFLFIDPAVFGEYYTRFRSQFCLLGGFQGKQIKGYLNEDQFKDRMGMLSVRVSIDDVVDLPPSIDEERLVKLSPQAMRVYKEVRDEFISDYEGGVILGDNVLRRLLRLQQITSGFTAVTDPNSEETREVSLDTAKTDALIDLLTDIDPSEPVVVFTRFVRDLYESKRAAVTLGRPAYQMGGGKKEKDEWCLDADRGKGPLIAVQVHAGGEGINEFVRSRYCVYYSLGFSLNDYRQSRGRLRRPGQERPVIYYHLIVPGTVDRLVYQALSRRQRVVDHVVERLVRAEDLVS